MHGPDLRAFLLTTVVAATVGAAVGGLGAWMTEAPAAPPAPSPGPDPVVEISVEDVLRTIPGEVVECGPGALGIEVAVFAAAKSNNLSSLIEGPWPAKTRAAQTKYRRLPEGLLGRVVLVDEVTCREFGLAPEEERATSHAALVPVEIETSPGGDPELAFHREVGRRVFDRIATSEVGARWTELHAAGRTEFRGDLTTELRDDLRGPDRNHFERRLFRAGFVRPAAASSVREDFASFHAAAWTWGEMLSPRYGGRMRPRRARERFDLLERAGRELGLLGPGETLRHELPVCMLPVMCEFGPEWAECPGRRVLARRSASRPEPTEVR